ncbi:MAG: PASTA domain-containing protein [Bacteroidales bacterium]|nr:PASTA domain-containing protein [Bacteroidales bacterium]
MAKKKFSLSLIKDFLKKHPIIANLLYMVLATVLILWAVLIFLRIWTRHGETAIVPDVKHMSYAEAAAVLSANGLTIEINDSIYERTLKPGTIVESWPKAGAVVKDGRPVYVTVTAFSTKQVTLSMPLTNVSERQAVSYLRGLGINDIRIVPVPSLYPDLVVSARYGDTPITVGTVIPVTSTVTLEVGSGPAQDEEEETENLESTEVSEGLENYD